MHAENDMHDKHEQMIVVKLSGPTQKGWCITSTATVADMFQPHINRTFCNQTGLVRKVHEVYHVS